MNDPYPRVGIGVILVNTAGDVLLGKRKNSHAPYWSIPGGHLEMGESFEACAIREVMEETGIALTTARFVAVTNNLQTYEECGKHYISIILLAEQVTQQPQLCEPEKCEGWRWFSPRELPEPHFEASRHGIQCWLKGIPYPA
jgi:8-oxo-dGTP diphosphatase